ncbi:ribbon-helix-helix protein, CopG family [Fictibacillus gelatini]|uniref:ribbon-helix-helix protein, CopG family n=1 Tax=Fictibacillus gelatini TaxID=225985 RepID=UPI00041D5B67|nr:ribbon-helix-helix protein, CopG family [Fictibacillus gelatini]
MAEQQEKRMVSILVEQDTYDKITEIQKETGIFSRSKLLRDLIDRGLKTLEKEA